MPRSKLHALLIGIDRYNNDGRPALGLYPDLEGAVRDVERLEGLLHERGLPPRQIRKLTAPLDETVKIGAPPTYEGILESVQEIRRRARREDRVLIAFSGHGGRVPTLCPEAKGPDGIDEALVPASVADSGTRYLRDVEMAYLLRRMTDDGLLVTLVLDCCHAGGVSREKVRGTCLIDRTGRPAESLVASREELVRTWRFLTGRRPRSLVTASGWLPNPRGYVLLAACQAYERAYEGWYDASGPGGALTRALIDAARLLGPEATCRELHERILPQVREWNESQTPQLEGDADRIFLGCGERLRSEQTISPGQRCPTEIGGTWALDDSWLAARWKSPDSYLAGKVRLAPYRLPADFDPAGMWGGALLALIDGLEPLAGEVTARVGEWLCLVLENSSRQPLHITIFDHEPGGDVSRVYPAPGVGASELLPAGRRQALPLKAGLPGDLRSGTDVIQVVAAADPTFFRRFVPSSVLKGRDWIVIRLEVRLVRAPPERHL